MANATFGRPSGTTSWDSPVVCSQSGDAVSFMFPMQPAPLGFDVPTGISRHGQIGIIQHTTTFPALPAYCDRHGGVVWSNTI